MNGNGSIDIPDGEPVDAAGFYRMTVNNPYVKEAEKDGYKFYEYSITIKADHYTDIPIYLHQ